MSGNKLLIDTNILIYLSKKDIELQDFAGRAYEGTKGLPSVLTDGMQKIKTQSTP